MIIIQILLKHITDCKNVNDNHDDGSSGDPKHGFTPDAARLGYLALYPIPEEFANAWWFSH